MWLNKLDKQERYVNGTKISVKNGEELYYKVLKTAQETNKRLGYGDRGKEWIGQYTNEKTINYIMKYITKVDEDHKGFKAVILTSAGIGKSGNGK